LNAIPFSVRDEPVFDSQVDFSFLHKI
jgi:hypothetical protein